MMMLPQSVRDRLLLKPSVETRWMQQQQVLQGICQYHYHYHHHHHHHHHHYNVYSHHFYFILQV